MSKDPSMYARQNQPTEVMGGQYGSPPVSAGGPRGGGMNGYGGYDAPSSMPAAKSEPAPDLLLQAFNQALRPYTDKVDTLEGEIADLRAYIDQLEGQRSEVHAWIDKRGLRPGKRRHCAHRCPGETLTQETRCATINRSTDGHCFALNLAYARGSDAQRAARPQNNNRQLRPPPLTRRSQRLSPDTFFLCLHA